MRRTMPLRSPFASLLLCCFLFSAPLPAGNVLEVGPTRQYATVAAALAVAQDGDLIVVDPGTVAAFDVNGVAVTILSRGGATAPFTVVQTTGAPAVRVRNLSAAQSAAVSHFTIAWGDGSAPAVSIEQCAGAVRLADVVVTPVANLPQVAARGGLEVIGCQAVWCTNLIVGSLQSLDGSTTNLLGAPILDNAGLCALFAQDSSLLLDRVALRGFDNAQLLNGTCYGGDAMRLGGACHVSLVVNGLGSCELIGGAGAVFGGSAIHVAQPTPGIDVDLCGLTRLVKGGGSQPGNDGGYLAANNDRGVVSIGPNITIERFPVACLLDAVGYVSLANDVVAPGAVAHVALASIYSRPFILAMSTAVGFGRINGVQGRQVFDWLAPSTIAVAALTLPANGYSLPLAVPNSPSLRGLTVALQGLMGPGSGSGLPLLALTMPAWLTIGQ